MTPAERNHAAKMLLSNRATYYLFESMRQGHLEAIAASPLPDVASREYAYAATRVIADMLGQLEAWAREAK